MRNACLLILVGCLFPQWSGAEELAGAGDAGPAVTVTAARNPQWLSYRHAYRAMKAWQAYDKAKDLLLPRLVLYPAAPHGSSKGIQLRLVGKQGSTVIPLDSALRAEIPVDDAAYEEDAELVLNRPSGTYRSKYVLFIADHPDQVYPVERLREACRQAYEFHTTSSLFGKLQLLGKQCTGILFMYRTRHVTPVVTHVAPDGGRNPVTEIRTSKSLQMLEVIHRFSAAASNGAILLEQAPDAIMALIE